MSKRAKLDSALSEALSGGVPSASAYGKGLLLDDVGGPDFILALTDSEIIAVIAGMLGRRSITIPLSEVQNIGIELGLSTKASIRIGTTGDQYLFRRIDRVSAISLHDSIKDALASRGQVNPYSSSVPTGPMTSMSRAVPLKYIGGIPGCHESMTGRVSIGDGQIFFWKASNAVPRFQIPLDRVVEAFVDTEQELRNRVTLTRLAVFGTKGAFIPKTTMSSTAYLTVELVDSLVVFEARPSDQLRQLAGRICAEGSGEKAAPAPTQVALDGANSLASRLAQLDEARDQGLIGEDEYRTARARLLDTL